MARPSLRQSAGAAETRLPKADQVHLALKQAITRGELPPGAAIDKAALCLRFGVSRLPVTTAIHRLAYEGLVLIEPQKGSYVSRIRLDDVLQWMMARCAIESEVAAEAARRLAGRGARRRSPATSATRRRRWRARISTASSISTSASTTC